MTSHLDWLQLLEQRRRLAGEPDEATLERHQAHWRHALERPENLTDEDLDEEMVKLLELIHLAH